MTLVPGMGAMLPLSPATNDADVVATALRFKCGRSFFPGFPAIEPPPRIRRGEKNRKKSRKTRFFLPCLLVFYLRAIENLRG
jgi:hypothetical protein